MGRGEVGLEGHRLGQPPQSLERQAEVVMSLGKVRLHGDRLGDGIGGNVGLARLQGDHPEQMQGDGLLRIGLEDTLVNILGLGQAPRHVMLAALIEGLLDVIHCSENPTIRTNPRRQ